MLSCLHDSTLKKIEYCWDSSVALSDLAQSGTAMVPNDSFLFYDDEDKLLPLMLHGADEQGRECSCVDCIGLRARMLQIARLQSARASQAA